MDDLAAGTAKPSAAGRGKAAAVHNAVLPDVPQKPARDRYWWHHEEHASHSCC
ncbi:hypothetical protein ABZ922_15360 [Streptomyces shenzhenensis]|uniref:hypothetical protein n=1 Tax=Streptomyces shenzhenensis TaxID=943815 RepID=UPI0033FE32EC